MIQTRHTEARSDIATCKVGDRPNCTEPAAIGHETQPPSPLLTSKPPSLKPLGPMHLLNDRFTSLSSIPLEYLVLISSSMEDS